jgi:hypothetical protein
MSLKKLLGLENFPIKDFEIMHKIVEARKQNKEVVEFNFDGHCIKVKIPPQTHLDGLMRGWADYFKDSW